MTFRANMAPRVGRGGDSLWGHWTVMTWIVRKGGREYDMACTTLGPGNYIILTKKAC